MTIDLGTFEDGKVVGTTLKITNTGDGLSRAMQVEPQLLHSGQTVFVVLECEVGPITFDPVEDSGTYERKHSLKAGRATFADRKAVVKLIEETATKIQGRPRRGHERCRARPRLQPPRGRRGRRTRSSRTT